MSGWPLRRSRERPQRLNVTASTGTAHKREVVLCKRSQAHAQDKYRLCCTFVEVLTLLTALRRAPPAACCCPARSSSRRARAKRVNAVHELCNFRQHFHLKSVQVRIHDAVPCVKTHGCVQVPLLGRTRSQGVQASLPYLAHIISYNSIHTRSISLHWECLRLHGRRHCSPGVRWACGAKLVAHRVQPTTDWPTPPNASSILPQNTGDPVY